MQVYRVMPQCGKIEIEEVYRATAKSIYHFKGAPRTSRMSGSTCYFDTLEEAQEYLREWYPRRIEDLQRMVRAYQSHQERLC